MLRLAVTTTAESFERIQAPLAARDIDVGHLAASERSLPLTHSTDTLPFDAFDVGYVYPSRLMEGAVIDAILGLPWVNGREAVLTSRNKAGVLARLDQAGIPVPESVMLSNPLDEAVVRERFHRFEGPVVVKPNSTTRGVGVARTADLDTFLGIVDYLNLIHEFPATGDKAYIVQEFIPDATDLRVMVLDGNYAGAVQREVPAGPAETDRWKHNVHRGAEAVGVTPPDRVRELAETVAEILDISLLGVDFLVADDAIYVSETNARPTIDRPEKYEAGFFDELATLVRGAATAD